MTTFYCDPNYVYHLDIINFSFGEYALVYHLSKLFSNIENSAYSQFMIVSNSKRDEWILGMDFISFRLSSIMKTIK